MRGCTGGPTRPTGRAGRAGRRRARGAAREVTAGNQATGLPLLEHGPLYGKRTFLAYDAVQAIAGIGHLSHTNSTILDEYEEGAEDE